MNNNDAAAPAALTFEEPPATDSPTLPTREEIRAALDARPGEWAVVSRHDRAARAAGHVERIMSGREYGAGYVALARRVGNEHRVYAQKR
jgi:hypothetical protein